MIALSHLWRWWTESWHAPRRARLLYVAMAAAFGGLAIAGVVAGDALVATVAAIAAAASVALAVAVPRLRAWTTRDTTPLEME